jgi:hypothetical protein
VAKQSATNELTTRILNFFFSAGIFCWRQNTSPIPIQRDRQVIGFRSGGISGQPDIVAILPPTGRYLGIEVKTSSDRLRPTQVSFRTNSTLCGAAYLEVKTFEDFLNQFNELKYERLNPTTH